MEIMLKNIYTSERLSQETTAFQATLYINGYRTGVITNDGQGGATMYRLIDDEGVALIREAEAWCRALPPVVFPDTMSNGRPVTIPMELEMFLDNMVNDWLVKKDIEAFRRKTEKKMENGILFGVPGKMSLVMRYAVTIESLIRTKKGVEQLRRDIRTKILPLLRENQKILNTNIPWEIVKQLEVPAGKWVEETIATE